MRFVSSLFVVMLLAGAAAAEPAFKRIDLVSDATDPNLKNAWGLAAGPDTPWWVANNHTNTATVYSGDGSKHAFVVTVPGAPTGEVFNESNQFPVCTPRRCSPARFIFAGEEGVLAAYAPDIPRPGPSDQAFVVFTATDGAIYKGLTQVHLPHSVWRLYATDFHNGKVDTFNGNFEKLDGDPLFVDPTLPAGYAPFGIQAIGDRVFVTYALQDANKEDDVKGPGHGFIDEYDLSGFFVRRVASRGHLNSPWGLAVGPESFGDFDDTLLVGNFGDGRINSYRFVPHEGRFVHEGVVRDRHGAPIEIDGLWSIVPGNGGPAGSHADLYFTAGPNGEENGLFGLIRRARR